MINVNKIFNMFEESQDTGFPGTVYIDFKDHPAYWVGMFEKTILNYENYCVKILQLFKNASPVLDLEDIKDAGEYIVFNRAFEYIKDLDLTNNSHLDSLESRSSKRLVNYIIKSIDYFVSVEEYEKCAILKKIQDQVELFLK